jgi:hypothetical protein
MKRNALKLVRPLLFGIALGLVASAAQALPNRCSGAAVHYCQLAGYSQQWCCLVFGG